MPQTTQNPIDVDEVLRRIKLEIANRDQERGSDQPGASGVTGLAGYLPRIAIGPVDLQLRREYSCAEFTQFHDARFMENACRNILGRLGGQSFLEALRCGRLSKIEILGRLRYSPEGRRRGITINGLLPMFILQTLFKIPLLGYILETIFHLCRLPKQAWAQRMLEQQIANNSHDLALQINECLDEVERAINSAREH